MLDMGFLPDIRRVLKHLPPVAQTLFFSATLPAPIATCRAQMLRNPVAAQRRARRRRRPPASPRRSTRCAQDLKSALLLELLQARATIENALVFTRTKHRANRLAEFLERHGVACDRIHGNRSQAAAHAGAGRLQERPHPGAGGDRHRGARHRRRGAVPRRQLRRAERAGGLHPPRGPHRPRRRHRRRLHLRLAARR